jgi:hypothetical protein
MSNIPQRETWLLLFCNREELHVKGRYPQLTWSSAPRRFSMIFWVLSPVLLN